MNEWNATSWLTACALLLSPCDASAGEKPRDDSSPSVGSLTLQWSITGRRDPSDCGALGVASLNLSLRPSPLDAPLLDDGEQAAPCDVFELSLDLPPGSYEGKATLVDRFDRPVTLAVTIESVEIVVGQNVVKSVDFPVAAFL